MKNPSIRLLVYAAFIASLIIVSIFYLWMNDDLAENSAQLNAENKVSYAMDNLDKLNTSITYIEHNEKPHSIALIKSKAAEIEMGYAMADTAINKLKLNCDGVYFQKGDILALEAILKAKKKQSQKIIFLASNGNPDAATQLLQSNTDSILVHGFVNRFNDVFNRGQKLLKQFRDAHVVQTRSMYNLLKIISGLVLLFLLITCWKILRQLGVNNRLLAQKRMFAEIIRNTNDAIIITGTDLLINYCNDATEKLFKLSKDQIIGKNADEIFRTIDIEQVTEQRNTQILEKGHWNGDVKRIDAEGNVLDLNVSVSSIYDHKGAVVGYSSISLDIS
jgi:PAS domain S-box-containing protein